MKKMDNVKTESFDMTMQFVIDIVETEEEYESYIQLKGYGVKELMFGMPKDQQSREEFLEIVEANFSEHAAFYMKQYAD